MNWLLLTFISVTFRAIYGVLTKMLSNNSTNSIYTQSVLLPFAACCLTIIMSPILGGITFNFAQLNWLTLILMIIGSGIGNITYFAAIKYLTSGTAQITFSSILIFNTIISVLFLNLHLSSNNLAGIFLLIIAVISVAGGKLEYHPKGVGLMLLSAFCFAISQLSSSKLATQISPTDYLIFNYLRSALLVLVYKGKIVLKDLKHNSQISTIAIPFITAIPSVLSILFVFFAYRYAPQPAKVALLSTSQVVIAVLLSYVFLKEKTQLFRKTCAAGLVVTAAYLIKS